MKPLVSVITPVYNAASYLRETVESVRQQTFSNWEMILVDDCSTDESRKIILELMQVEPRLRCILFSENQGAAKARNAGLAEAKGDYIAYLDADDLWLPGKLERQLNFMEEHRACFSCCSYMRIREDGTCTRSVRMPEHITYQKLLGNTVILTSGVMVKRTEIDVKLLQMPDVRRGQDTATWLQLLKAEVQFCGQDEVLFKYRAVPTSLSANRWEGIKRTWNIYQNIQYLPRIQSIWYIIWWAIHAVGRRVYWPWGR